MFQNNIQISVDKHLDLRLTENRIEKANINLEQFLKRFSPDKSQLQSK